MPNKSVANRHTDTGVIVIGLNTTDLSKNVVFFNIWRDINLSFSSNYNYYFILFAIPTFQSSG